MLPSTYVADFHNEAAVCRMPYRRLGRTGLDISLLSLGGSPFGDMYNNMDNQSTINQIVTTAVQNGVNFIDTSYWYGQGLSEERLGEVSGSFA